MRFDSSEPDYGDGVQYDTEYAPSAAQLEADDIRRECLEAERPKGQCAWCQRVGQSYTYHGQRFDGLVPYRGERICPLCAELAVKRDGVDIHVVDRGGIDYVFNTTRDAGMAYPRANRYREG